MEPPSQTLDLNTSDTWEEALKIKANPEKKRVSTRSSVNAKSSQSNEATIKKEKKMTESDDELEDGNYVVEKIIKHRIRNDKTEYFLKWKGYPDSDNTWEKAENIFDQDMVETYWKNPVFLEGRHIPPKEPTTELVLVTPNHPLTKLDNWDKSVRYVETITKDIKGELIVYLIWNDGCRTCHPIVVANIKCPQKLLKFYEDNIFFKVPHLPF